MAEDSNRFRCYDVHHGVYGRRSLPAPGMTSTPERSPLGLPKSTSNIAWRDRSSLTPERHQHTYKGRPLADVFSKDYKGRLLPDHKMSFGTPSYPSPLDRIRAGYQDRTFQPDPSSVLPNNASFEGNQSFPKVSKHKQCAPARKLHLDNFRGSDLNEVSFSAGFSKGSFHQCADRSLDHSGLDRSFPSRDVSLNHSRDITGTSSKESSFYTSSGERSLENSWSFYNYIGGGDSRMAFPTTVRNPNKAICTINGKTSEILIANEMACELFGYKEEELIGMMLNELMRLKPRDQATIQESHLEASGEVVSLAGKVIEAVDKSGLVLPVSMWVKKLDPGDDDGSGDGQGSAGVKRSHEPRCVVVMEPVERSVATLKFTADGTIISCDGQMAYIHGYQGPEDLQGSHVRDLIPAFKLPVPGEPLTKDVRKQRATGRTKDGASFPMSVAVDVSDDSSDDDDEDLDDLDCVYRGVIWVFANISGLITILPDGNVHSINENFALMLFGYRSSEVVGKDISVLIPDFFEILDLIDDSMPLPPVDDEMSDTNTSVHLSVHSEDSGRISSRTSSKGVGSADSDDQGMGTSITSSTACTRPNPEGVVKPDDGGGAKVGGVAKPDDGGGAKNVTVADSTLQKRDASGEISRNTKCVTKVDAGNGELIRAGGVVQQDPGGVVKVGGVVTHDDRDVASDSDMAKINVSGISPVDTEGINRQDMKGRVSLSTAAEVQLNVEEEAVRDTGGVSKGDVGVSKGDGGVVMLDVGGFSLHGPGSTSTPNRNTQGLSERLSGSKDSASRDRRTLIRTSPLINGAESVVITSSVHESPKNGTINISSDSTPQKSGGTLNTAKTSPQTPGGIINISDSTPWRPGGIINISDSTLQRPGGIINISDSTLQRPGGIINISDSTLQRPGGIINISDSTLQRPGGIINISDSTLQRPGGIINISDSTPRRPGGSTTGEALSSHSTSAADGNGEKESTGLVFTIDSYTGKYESESPIDEKEVIKGVVDETNTVKSVAKVKLTTSHAKPEFGSSTPDYKAMYSIKKADILASPCFSDIVRLDSSIGSPCDSSALEGGDEMEASDANVDDKVNTTDDLIEAVIGMVKLSTLDSSDDTAKQNNSGKAVKIIRDGKIVVGNSEELSGKVVSNTADSKSESGDRNVVIISSEEESLVTDRSSEVSNKTNASTIEIIEDVDMSSLHQTSVNRFLSSRCNRSKNLDNSTSFLGQNGSRLGDNSRSFLGQNGSRLGDSSVYNSRSFLGQNGSRLGDSSVQNVNNSSSRVETYYPLGFETPDFNSNNAYSDFTGDISDYGDGNSPSLQSFEYHEKGVRYMSKPGNGSKSSDYSSNGSLPIPEGSYQGHCQHRDSSLLGIVFQIRRVQLEDGSHVYCMWVSRDPEEPGECGRSYANLTLASSLNSTAADFSLGEALIGRAHSASKHLIDEAEEIGGEKRPAMEDHRNLSSSPFISPSPPTLDKHSVLQGSVDSEEDRALNYGPYSQKYQTLHSIGKGAFGFVKLAQRRTDKKMVVVKFIRRSKVFSDCWVNDDRYGGRLPLEVSLLTKLNHHNIVKVTDVFENSEFIQMVMEKHGSGMDLFEFIDRSPQLDEPLASYIFRQMVSAVSYLHSKNILHRDIKDENVILSEHFQIKLIDFGAVAFMQPGKLFATFCGTLEYCSPEVLMGNRYRGPELEVWSMGVTLYTLIFGENPFFDTDETIKCVLKPPFTVSSELMMLLYWLLHPDPLHRASIPSLEKNIWITQPVDIDEYSWSEVLPNSEFYGNTASDNRPESPPVSDRQTGHLGPAGPEIDQLKCNLLNQLNLSDHDPVTTFNPTNPFSRKY